MARQFSAKQKIFYGNIFTKESAAYYRKHIIEFVEDIIFQRKPEYYLSDQQKTILLDIQHNRRTAVKSGKGIGKSAAISFAIIWFMSVFDNPKVICSAPTAPTLYSALWPEIKRWLDISIVSPIFEHTAQSMYLKEDKATWFRRPRVAKDAISLQGLHSENMLIIVDEASGFNQAAFESFDTTLTSKNNKLVLIGNPNLNVGCFYDCFNKLKKRWKTSTHSALDSPFVVDNIEYYTEKYGVNHDLYKVNILGEFPSGNPESFLKLSDIQEAILRSEYLNEEGDIEIGLDVARFGDDSTVLFYRKGMKVATPKILEQNSIPEAAELVIKTVQTLRDKYQYTKQIKVKVDATGLGAGVCDILKLDRENNILVVECNNGGAGNDRYANEISIMWGILKDNLHRMALPDDSSLKEELSSRRWKITANGKIQIEPKSEFKKQYGASPDRADALCLCFFNKEIEHTVVRNFDALDTNLIKDSLNYISDNRMASMFYSKTLMSSLLYSSFDGRTLFVYDEHMSQDSLFNVVSNIHQHGELKRIIGNDKMFSVNGDDLSSKFRKYRVNVYESLFFNELSAIEQLNNMINQRNIIIHKNCKRLIEQLQSWKIEGSKFDMEDRFGLCYSLLLIVSELRLKIGSTLPVTFGNVNTAVSGYGHSSDDQTTHWMI